MMTVFEAFMSLISKLLTHSLNQLSMLWRLLSNKNQMGIPDITILYQNEDFIVVDKKADVKINSDDPKDIITVSSQLQQKFPQTFNPELAHGYRFVHRLDFATSGALCVSLTKSGAHSAGKAFQERNVTKHYLALVRGFVQTVHGKSMDIDTAIGKDSSVQDFNKMCVENNPSCVFPRKAHTKLVLLQHGHYDGKPASFVLLVPLTGRTHQLRVHCAHIGHLIIGDYTYSNREDIKPHRMMLHAHRLIIHMGQRTIDVTAPNPFESETDALWQPKQTFYTYKEFLKDCNLLKSSDTNRAR